MTPFLPAFLLALFAFGCGTFTGSATFAGAAAGQVTVLAFVAFLAPATRLSEIADPLRLGRAGRWLLAALLVAVAGSLAASPVPRAGLVGVVLLPFYLLLPAAVARAWRRDPARAELAVAAVVGAVAAWSLLDGALHGRARPALPLGHHNLLAGWLAIGLPLAALPWRRGAREGSRAARGVAGTAVVLALAAILAARSLGALLALVPLALFALQRLSRRLRWGLALLALGALALQAPRLLALASGRDPSLAAREVYWRAGIAGIAERPLAGWGPGAVPWTIGSWLRPVPGISPPSEVVGQLHSLPVELAYDLGLPGLALAAGVGLVFAQRRWLARGAAGDPATLAAGSLGLLAGAVASLTDAWLRVPALPLALALAAGVALAGEDGGTDERSLPPARRGLARALLALAALVAAGLLLAPARALREYEGARVARTVAETRAHLARAVALDPAFALYRAHLARYAEPPSAELARQAAEAAPGVAALWLSAGVLGLDTGEPWATAALRRALAADPFGALAPFYLATAQEAAGTATEAADCGARALLAEPRLAASPFWGEHRDLAAAARARILAWPGIEPGLRLALADLLAPGRLGPAGRDDLVALEVGAEDAAGLFSRYAFERPPWPALWWGEPLARAAVDAITVPAATVLPSSSAAAFPLGSCAPPGS